MTYLDEATETLPREQLAGLQLGKLQAMMAELWNRNGFYTAKWNMAGMDIKLELCQGADPEVVHEIAIKLDSMLAFRPRIHHVGRNALPRFEMKAKRFHVKLDA